MFCYNCGEQIDEKAVVCPHCGVLVAGKSVNFISGQINNEQGSRVSGFSIAGFVLSFFGWLSALGLIFCILGYNKSIVEPNKVGKNLALAGIIICCVDFVLFTIGLSIVFASIANM